MSNMIALVVVALAVLSASVDASCKRHDRHRCCRKKIDYGGCHHHVRRWAYNVTCGRCVEFDYSGCGGDENNFDCRDDCEGCCKDTPPCPKFSLPKPPEGCEYKWYDGPDSCPRAKMVCKCPKVQCRPDSCHHGQRCIPEPEEKCDRCPCKQYRCETDPCQAVSQHLRPCEKCVAVQAPTCHHKPCPLVAHRENHCPKEERVVELVVERVVEQPRPRHHCPHRVECPPSHNPCHYRRCHRHPEARCVVDECDCRKVHWRAYEKIYSDSEC